MASPTQRNVLHGVERPQSSGPESDGLCHTLNKILKYMGERTFGYPYLLGTSGEGFKVIWNDDKYFQDQDLEPEDYLRDQLEPAAVAVRACGYEPETIVNKDYVRPMAGVAAAEGDAKAVRETVVDSIDSGRPVFGALSMPTDPWLPIWSVLTGYDDAGQTVLGWWFFQDDEGFSKDIEVDDEGYFRLADWEATTPVVLRLTGDKNESVDEDEIARLSLQRATKLLQGVEHDGWWSGVSSYDACERAILSDDTADLDDSELRRRLECLSFAFVGDLASHKWYTSEYLRGTKHNPWNVSDILHAAADYARMHERMWECWKVAGGYWRRDYDGEARKFRDTGSRKKMAAIIREAGELDRDALAHLESALGSWDKTHGYYTKS